MPSDPSHWSLRRFVRSNREKRSPHNSEAGFSSQQASAGANSIELGLYGSQARVERSSSDGLENDKLCTSCACINFDAWFSPHPPVSLWLDLGPLQSNGCSFGDRIIQAAKQHPEIKGHPNSYIFSIEQGSFPAEHYLGLSGIAPSYRLLIIARVMRGTRDSRSVIDRLELCEDAAIPHTKDRHTLRMCRKPLSPVFEPSLLSKWLKSNHATNRIKFPSAISALGPLISSSRFRLLDVRTGNMLVIKTPVSYFTLSYAWGQSARPIPYSENEVTDGSGSTAWRVDLRLQPSTIRDAVLLVQSLGEQYLWVVTLCIDQTDDEDKAAITAQMDALYSTCGLTIIAASGDHGDHGLCRLRSESSPAERPVLFQQRGQACVYSALNLVLIRR